MTVCHRLVLTSGVALAATLVFAAPSYAQDSGGNAFFTASDIPWIDLGGGVQRAVLYGDASKPGELFAFRLLVPDGFEMGAHTHPVAEHMSVISGKFFVGLGEKLDRDAAIEYGAGGYAVVAAEVPAYMFAVGETVVEIHGVGPLLTTFLEEN